MTQESAKAADNTNDAATQEAEAARVATLTPEDKAAEDAKALETAAAAKVIEDAKLKAAEPKVDEIDPATGKPKVAASLMDDAARKEKEAQAIEDKRLIGIADDKLTDEEKPLKAEALARKEAADKEAKLNSVPEKYEFKVPEGMVMNPEYAEKASVIMKKHGITQGAASELGELAAEQMKVMAAEKVKADEANFNAFVEDLKKESVDTFQKEGKDTQKELAFAAKSRDRLASPELIDKLNKSGLANDISVLKFFVGLGRTISEGKLIEGVTVTQNAKGSVLDKFYPNTK